MQIRFLTAGWTPLPSLYNTEDGLTNSVLYQELLKPQLLSLDEGIRYDIEQARHLAGQDVETSAQREIFETEQGYADRLLEAVSRMTTNWPTRLRTNKCSLRVGRVLRRPMRMK